MSKKGYVIIIVLLLGLIGVFEWLNKSPTSPATPPPPAPIVMHMTQQVLLKNWNSIISMACQPARGGASAAWTMVEIGDFQCPQCGKVHGIVEHLVDGSKGKLKLYFLNWPLAMHNNSHRAALAALAAEKQGKFWQMYNQIYDNQKGIDDTDAPDADSTLLGDASNSGLDIHAYEQARKSSEIKGRLQAQSDLVTSLQTQSTPTFLLRKNGTNIVYFFIGSRGQDPTANTPAYPGLNYLEKNPPWTWKTLPPPPDIAPPGTYGTPSKT